MKYYIIAGERSGDLHASNLIKELKKEDPDASFRGFGGDYIREAGAELAADYHEMAVMGLVEVLTSLAKIKRYLSLCVSDIQQYKPDAVILVDFGGFNLRIAKRIADFKLTKIYYITPKIWAWNQKRAFKIKKYIDKAFVILPFEEDFFAGYDVDATYIGNPVMDAVKDFTPDSEFLAKLKLKNDDKLVALLPGSRKQELKQLLPTMIEVARNFPEKTFGLSMISKLPKELYEDALAEPNIIPVIEDNYNLLNNAEAAVVTSGTATLETGLFNVPQVVIYRTSQVNYAIGIQFVKVKYISLVNLIVNKDVLQELIQKDVTTEAVTAELGLILNDKKHHSQIMDGYQELRNKLKDKNASKTAAKEIFKLVSAN